jgi:hypothetical protein
MRIVDGYYGPLAAALHCTALTAGISLRNFESGVVRKVQSEGTLAFSNDDCVCSNISS